MLKKIVACCVVAVFAVAGSAVISMSSDPGPADIELVSANSKKPKPAVFPHKKHQDAFGCGECHHGMAEDGSQVPYADGQAIGKCDDCHNSDKMAGKTKGKLKLDTPKGWGHGNCLDCHKKMAKDDGDLKAKGIAKCATCHPKKN
jgi:hypothetical protein